MAHKQFSTANTNLTEESCKKPDNNPDKCISYGADDFDLIKIWMVCESLIFHGTPYL
jgi:hypothetical protein